MSRFGTYLHKLGLLTAEQLDLALAHRAEHGARLGTNLVELGRIDVELLAECLSGYHGVPLPPRKWLQRPQRAAVKRVTRALVERVRFVPMRLEGTVLHVAVMDPRHPRVLDDLRFASGCRIEPYVLPEIWMHDWLLALFDIPRGIRDVVVTRKPTEPPELDPMYDFQAVQLAQAPQPPQVPAPTVRPAASAPPRAPEAKPRTTAPGRAPAPRRAQRPHSAAITASVTTSPPAPAWGSIAPVAAATPAVTVRSLAELAAAIAPIEAPPIAASPIATPPIASPPIQAPPHEPLAREPEVSSFWERRPVFNWSVPEEPGRQLPAAPPPAGLPPEPEADPELELLPEPELESEPEPEPDPELELVPEPEPEPADEASSAQPSGVVGPPSDPAAGQLAQLEAALQQVEERERLIELSFAIGTGLASTLALFVVQRGMVQGLRCVTRGTERAIDGVLPLEPPCMLIDAASATESVRVNPGAQPSDQRVLQLLDDDAAEVGLFPVAIKGRVVNVLYASNGGEPLGAIAFAALAALAQEMGAAYERLILTRKAAGSR